MATDRSKKPYGEMPCEGVKCRSHDKGQVVVVMRNKNGTLSYNCQWCGRTPHALPGTGQHEDWESQIKKFVPENVAEQIEAAAAESAAAEGEQAPRTIKKNSGWPLYREYEVPA